MESQFLHTRAAIILLFLFIVFANGMICFGASEAPFQSYVNTDSVNLRSAPSTSASVLALLHCGQSLTVTTSDGDWQCVVLENELTGWVYAKFLSVNPMPDPLLASRSRSPLDEMLDYAYSFLNCRYRRGGASPSGFDCSGFTMHVYSKMGFSLPHQAILQSGLGLAIEKNNLRKGDLVFFKTLNSRVINHVGIYVGDGNFIHASSGCGYVRISPLSTGYYLHCYQSARRLFNLPSERAL